MNGVSKPPSKNLSLGLDDPKFCTSTHDNKQLFISISGGSRISRRGGGGEHPLGGHGLRTLALFGENVCENERIGSHRGACAPPMSMISTSFNKICFKN